MNKTELKNVAHSYYEDRAKLLSDPKIKKLYEKEMLKLELAANIRKLRARQKISQKELAEKIKTTQAVISRIENAQVYPSTRIIERIAKVFGKRVKFSFV